MPCLLLVIHRVASSDPLQQHKTRESMPTEEEPKLFINGSIFPGPSPTSLLCCSSHKCSLLTNGALLKREMSTLSTDTRFNAYDKVTTEI